MAGDVRDRPMRADARANRDAILAAAAELFAERGLETSFEDIAQRAGVGRATTYRHFATREELLLELFIRLVDELERAAAAAPAGPDVLEHFLREAAATQVANLPLIEFQRSHRALPEEHVDALRERLLTAFARPLALGKAAGTVREDVTAEDVRILITMLTAAVRRDIPEADRRRALALAARAVGPA